MQAYELLEKNGVDLQDFRRWRMIQSTLDRRARGIETGVSDQVAMDGLTDPKIIAATPMFEAAHKIIQRVKSAGLQWMVDTGRISIEQKLAMESLNPYHVNWRRVLDPNYAGAEVPPVGGGVMPRRNIYRAKGGDQPIKDPALTDVDNLHLMIAEGSRNLVTSFIRRLALGNPDFAKSEGIFLKETIKPDISEELLRITDEDGEKVPPEVAASLGSLIAERKYSGRVGKGDVVHWEDGQMEIWHMNDPDLAELMKMPAAMPTHQLLDLAAKVAGWQRSGIMGEAGTSFRALAHGQYGALLAPGKFMAPWQDIIVGLGHTLFGPKVGNAMDRARANGTMGTSLVRLDQDYLKDDLGALYEKTGQLGAAWNYVMHPLQTVRMINQWITAQATGGRQIANVKAGYTPLRAAGIAAQAHLDFREQQANALVHSWMRTITFASTIVKTTEQQARAFQERPLMATFVFASLLAGGVLLYLKNHMDDETLPPGERSTDIPDSHRRMYWTPPIIGGVRLAPPKPYGPMMFFENAVEDMMRHYANTQPAEFANWRDLILTDFIQPAFPALVTPGVENWANKHVYNGQPIIPAGLEKQSDWSQYEASTTETAKNLAKALGPPNLNVTNFSPIMLENWVRGITGSAMMDAIKFLERPFVPESRPWEAADLPFVGSFFARHNYGMSSQPIQDFFGGSDDMIKSVATLNDAIVKEATAAHFENRDMGWTSEITAAAKALGIARTPGMDITDTMKDPKVAEIMSLSGTQEAFRTAGGLLRSINDSRMTSGEKRKWTDSITHGMVAAADAANLKLKAIKSGDAEAFQAAQEQETGAIKAGMENIGDIGRGQP